MIPSASLNSEKLIGKTVEIIKKRRVDYWPCKNSIYHVFLESLYEFLFSWADIQNPHTIRSLIIVSTGCALLVNWYGLTLGITNVLPHILYIPLILTAYFYPRWGVVFTACLSAIYGILVWSSSPDPDVLLSALARMTVFILIAAVVSYLSGRMQHDANLCQRLVSIV